MLKIGASAASIIASALLSAFLVYFFWAYGHYQNPTAGWAGGLFGPDRLAINLSWLVWAYLTWQLLTAALSGMSSAIRLSAILDIIGSGVPAVIIAIAMSKGDVLMAGKWEQAFLLLGVCMTDLIVGTLIMFIVNRRFLGGGEMHPAAHGANA